MPKSITLTPDGQLALLAGARTTSPPKPSSLQPGVADAGDEDLLLAASASCRAHLQLAGEEEEVAAGLAHQLLAGIVVDGDAEVELSS